MRISDWSSDVCSSDLACGFTYGQRSSQTTQTKRIFRYGPVWEARLRELIAEGTATSSIFKTELGVTVPTIQRRALELGIWHPRWSEQGRSRVERIVQRGWKKKAEERIEYHRSKWLALRREKHSLSISEQIGRASCRE